MNPLRPLNSAEMTSLRTGIRIRGVVVPIVVRPNGDIIDGHHRSAICDELKIECPSVVLDVTDAEAEALALDLNINRRQLTRAERDEAIERTRKALKLSDREVAERFGVSDDTARRVRRTTSANAEVVREGYRGGKPIKPRATPDEMRRLQDVAAEYRRQGYTVRQIAEAAGSAVSQVAELCQRAGLAGIRVGKPPTEPIPPIIWRDTPEQVRARTVELPPDYQRSTTVPLLAQIIETCEHDSAVVRFAYNVREAGEAGDQAWLDETAATLNRAAEYLRRLSAVMSDPDARERAISNLDERDETAKLKMHLLKSS